MDTLHHRSISVYMWHCTGTLAAVDHFCMSVCCLSISLSLEPGGAATVHVHLTRWTMDSWIDKEIKMADLG